ncbi:MAG TPA: SDR family oxidoreductase [Polyangiaceae bacterium]|nr:SDR family oxidoreductase [Polyangiaceae bacterium]
MDLGLRGKRTLVTGSTAGIGFASALLFAREGAEVFVNGRTTERVEQAVARLLQAEPAAIVHGIAADVSSAAGVQTLIDAAPELDVLVNNAGIFQPQPFEDITDASWMMFFETNVMSGVRLARHHFPRMMARGWGRIVFVSSESALQIPTEMIHYGMTKTAQLAVARGLAERTRGSGVTVNSVLPGPTLSEGVGTFVKELAAQQNLTEAEMERQFFTSARPSSLLQRFIDPREVAQMIAYVSSAAASATNGAALRVDGGVLRSVA